MNQLKFDKGELIRMILETLEADLEKARAFAKESRDAVIDEETKPENEYDTRAIEASYLAGAQAHRVRDLEGQILILKQTHIQNFAPGTPSGPSALLLIESQGKKQWVFLLPQSGGMTIRAHDQDIHVLTPQSPLGEALVGLRVGDCALIEHKGLEREYEVLSIQ